MSFRFTPSCCCGPTEPPVECDIVSDSFNRADSTSLGSDWTEEAGDWEIDSNELEITTTAACVLSTADNPDGPTSYVTALTKFSTTGHARLIVAATDENNYLYGEIAFAGALSVIRIGKRSGGTDTVLGTYISFISIGFDTNYSWYVCYNGTALTVGNVGGCLLSRSVSGFTGAKVGMGTGATVSGTINFDDFAATRVAEDCAVCDTCGSCDDCCDDGGPFEIIADFTGMTATDNECTNCEALPTEFTLAFFSSSPGFSCIWYLEYEFCDSPCGDSDPDSCGGFNIIIILTVDSACKPTLTFELSQFRAQDDCACEGSSQVEYEGSNGDFSGTCSGPITLTKVSESGNTVTGNLFTDPACIISFPATITLNAA